MATIKAYIRTSRKGNTLCNVRFRLSDGRDKIYYGKSNEIVYSDDWDSKKEKIKERIVYDTEKRKTFNNSIIAHKQYIRDAYDEAGDDLPKDWLETLLDKRYHPEKYQETKEKTFFDYFNEYVGRTDISVYRQKNLRVAGNILRRFEKYTGQALDVDTFDSKLLKSFESFVRDEYKIIKTHPWVYEGMSEKTLPKKRSRNTVIAILKYFRSFFMFCMKRGYSENDPFKFHELGTPTYGTPIFITDKERDIIADYDLSNNPSLAIQRDIFVFQCLVGCRVSDLMRFTDDNIRDGVLYYIAGKTSKDNPKTIEVPLSDKAIEIVERYKDTKGMLLPFISSQKYNDAIKEVFKKASITRLVTWLNPMTNKDEHRPINEIASSHMARRTFVGNLYKKVKDPNLVGSLSGHAEGSKAFARYRDIDLDMKKELINKHL